MNIHDDIKQTAEACSRKGTHFDALWHEQLERLLKYWNANIRMDLWDATKVILNSAGYHYDIDWNVTNGDYVFWYKYKYSFGSFFINPIRDRAYKMTIAVFETINHWCQQKSPIKVDFNKDELLNVLMHYEIHLEFD